MNISYNWLKSLIDFELSPQELAARLTMLGHAVDELVYLGQGLEGAVVGRVVALRPHPNADKLRLATVDYGAPELIEVVCGAPNVAVDGRYPLALEGAVLAGGFKIGRAKIRGVESCGMLCSERELGLSEEASGLMVLDGEALPGAPLARALGRDDWRLVIDATANRGDMWSQLGAARELQPEAGKKAALPDVKLEEAEIGVESLTSVTLEDPEGCPRYLAKVILDVKVGPSPRWLVERLSAVGQRSINNVVDVTNFVMFELGQPLHAFDLDRLDQRRIVVRQARPGEQVITLDGVLRRLDDGMTIIADAKKPVAVAGVMGDEPTEVSPGATRILLECALFDPAVTRRTSRRLGLATEASRRFERGTDYSLMEYAVNRAAQLIAEVAAGRVARGTIDVYPRPIPPLRLTLRLERASRVLGVEFPPEEAARLLEAIEFRVEPRGEGLLEVTVPPARRLDVDGEIDLIEELARVRGYNNLPVPERMSLFPADPAGRVMFRRQQSLRQALCQLGCQEARTYSFTSGELVETLYGAGHFAPLRLAVPLSSENEVLRPALVPALLGCLKRNLNQRRRDLRLFELGRVFTRRPGEQGTGEEQHLALLLTGSQGPLHWSGPRPDYDFFALKGLVLALFERLNVPAPEVAPQAHPLLHPGVAAALVRDGRPFGLLGQLDPGLARRLELPEGLFLMEMLAEPLVSGAVEPYFKGLTPFPGSRRDLSVLVDEDLPAGELLAGIAQDSPLAAEVSVFDLYQGEHVPAGRKSLSFSILFQSPERTLRDEEVDQAFQRIVAMLAERFGARQR